MQIHMRDRDPLTGVHTRASLIERLQNEVARARRYEEPFSVMMLDLDYFKSVNDAFGHLRGDQVLVQFTLLLKTILRDSDQVFRYGGDEFVLLLPSTAKSHAGVVARRLLDETLSQSFPGDPPVSITLSIGVANFPEDAQTTATLLEVADQRHYQAKRNGRCQVVDENFRKRTAPILNPPDRMVERDQQMGELNDFFRDLATEMQGIFLVSGPSGSGKSRFLAEAGRVARLQRQVVFDLAGKASLKHRQFGALFEGQWPWNFNPALLTDMTEFVDLLSEWMANKGDSGLVIAIDDSHELDVATTQFLQGLLAAEKPFQISYLLGVDQNAPRNVEIDAPLKKEILLSPLSYEGARVWLRQSLHWEPPSAFLRWILSETRGLPGEINATLGRMIESGALTHAGRDWQYRGDLAQLPIAEWLHGDKAPVQTVSSIDVPDFIGRVDELRQVREKLRKSRLVTIYGSAGVGKTRIALQIAMEESEQFSDRILLSSFTPHATPQSMTADLTAYFPDLRNRHDTWQVALQTTFRHRNILLVLDDANGADWQVDIINALLAGTLQVRIILTANTPLGLADEQTVAITGLDYPPHDDKRVRSTSYDAVQLFISCVRKNAPSASISTEDLAYVAKIVRLLHGHPLGIELAAAWIPAFYPHEIAAELERWLQQTGRLKGQPDQPDDDLGSIIETFWFMLSEPEQAVLSRLSVFQGDFTSQAARQIAGASPFFMDAVAAKAFVQRTAHGTYIFRERLRQMIYEKLNWNRQELELIREVHARYYLGLVGNQSQDEAALTHAGGEDLVHSTWNIRVAWQWALEARAVEMVRRFTGSLCAYYHRLRWAAEANRVCQDAIALLLATSTDEIDQQMIDEFESCANYQQ
jgi:diguanylate cyclase (GGDEF)-like protein